MSQDSCTQVVSIAKYQSRIAVDNFQNNMGPVKICRSVHIFQCARHERKMMGVAFAKVFLSALVIHPLTWVCCNLCFNNID